MKKKYFFDNCISYRFAAMLQALDVDAIALRDQHAEGIKDVPLFESLKGSGCVFITADRSQTTRLHEAKALKAAGIRALFLGPFWSKLTFWQQAHWLIQKWPQIEAFAGSVTPGTCAEIKQKGLAEVFRL